MENNVSFQADNFLTQDEARQKLITGINKVADAVKLTLGASGSNAILEENLIPYHIITNDGISIANKIQLQDPIENIGANIIREVADRTNKNSGDGTTTSIVLTQAILKEGSKSSKTGMQIKRELDEMIPLIDAAIDDQKKLITVDDVEAIATISAEDPEMGKLIQEIYQKIGKDGIIELDNSNTYETYYDIKEGVRLRNCGYISSYMANDKQDAIYKNPSILIAKQKIASIQDVLPLLEKLSAEGKSEIVIFCDEIDTSVVSTLVLNHVQGAYKSLIIKAPRLWKEAIFQDFAKITGATIVDPSTGINFKNLEIKHLGTCDKLITSKEETTVLGINNIDEHLAELRNEGGELANLRISWLSTKAAILKLGANSESELSYKRLKAEDAINASRLALQDGVVAGGGIALLNVANIIPNEILKEALTAPFWQILENAGITGIESTQNYGLTIGYDAKNNEYVDMWEKKILDPALVVKNSVRNAISIASTVLTTKVIVALNKKDEPTKKMPGMF